MPRPNRSNSAYLKGKQLYHSFMKRAPQRGQQVNVKPLPKIAIAIGKVVAVIYESNRGGEKNYYRHDFKVASRPLLAASFDGTQLILVGGSYRFTERGIVDK